MMAKDSVQKRLNGEARDGLSFTEFTYQLLQGYDFLHLYETKGCKDVYKRQVSYVQGRRDERNGVALSAAFGLDGDLRAVSLLYPGIIRARCV